MPLHLVRHRPRVRTGLVLAVTGLLVTLLPGAVGGATAGPAAPSAVPAATAPASTSAANAGAVARPRHDRTSRREARRVDRVSVRPRWRVCQEQFRCARVRVPMDYDRPRGRTVRLALKKYPAQSSRKIGTLFLNPGGPGGSATEVVALAPLIFPRAILDRFDIVGFDPRGVRMSTPVQCFRTAAAQRRALRPLTRTPLPIEAASRKGWLRAYRALGRACNTSGRPLAASMSSAQVARDMDVLRRAVGDRKLTYIGFSYGTALGQTYANMFPDRVRAMAMDGVLDPIAWAGRAQRRVPLGDRLRSADGAWRALRVTLARCSAAGAAACPLAARGDARASYAELAQRLRSRPLTFPEGGGTLDYPALVAVTLILLYQPGTGELLADLVDDSLAASDSSARPQAQQRAVTRAGRALARARELAAPYVPAAAATYDNSLETFATVACTDTRSANPQRALGPTARRADLRAPYFGAYWTWNVPCSRDRFRVSDEDAYRGGFRHRTRRPLLFVGNVYDPATRYEGALRADRLAPSSRLVTSDSWGHTAFGTSACVDQAVSGYLLRPFRRQPAVTRCVGDYQPFAGTTTASGRLLVSRLLTPPASW